MTLWLLHTKFNRNNYFKNLPYKTYLSTCLYLSRIDQAHQQSGNTLHLHSEDTQFESQPLYQPSWCEIDPRFSQQCFWWFSSPGMWHSHLVVIPDISKDCNALTASPSRWRFHKHSKRQELQIQQPTLVVGLPARSQYPGGRVLWPATSAQVFLGFRV